MTPILIEKAQEIEQKRSPKTMKTFMRDRLYKWESSKFSRFSVTKHHGKKLSLS